MQSRPQTAFLYRKELCLLKELAPHRKTLLMHDLLGLTVYITLQACLYLLFCLCPSRPANHLYLDPCWEENRDQTYFTFMSVIAIYPLMNMNKTQRIHMLVGRKKCQYDLGVTTSMPFSRVWWCSRIILAVRTVK